MTAPSGPVAPRSVRAAYEAAVEHGWTARIQYAVGPPSSVAVIVSRRAFRAYGWWRTDKGGVRWEGGATAGGRYLRTTAMFLDLLES